MSLKPELENAFEAGAKWAISEFLKDLWHPISEIPAIGRIIILENHFADGRIEFPAKMRFSTSRNPLNPSTQRWFYIEDLLPKEGGEQ